MLGALLIAIYVAVLSMFVGFEVLGKVAPTLQNALIAGMSAVSGVSLLASLYVARLQGPNWLGAAAVAFGAVNVVGSFVLSSRLLAADSKKRERA
jgi:NAD/NADP transhydrogenase alpha subunit